MLNRDPEYLAKLRDYYAEHRVLPSYSAVAALLGLRSTSAVAAMVKRMKAAGLIDSAPGGRLQPGHRFFERPVADSVSAGMPQNANDAPVEGLNVDAYLVDQPSRTVLLTVTGDSMIEAGLMPGDTIVVKRGAPAKPGDVVVAIVDNEFTVKYLAHDRRGFFLKPGNRAYTPIRPKDDLEIYGLVVGMFRKYQQPGNIRAAG
jgi:SOS regulatory protein LexA